MGEGRRPQAVVDYGYEVGRGTSSPFRAVPSSPGVAALQMPLPGRRRLDEHRQCGRRRAALQSVDVHFVSKQVAGRAAGGGRRGFDGGPGLGPRVVNAASVLRESFALGGEELERPAGA